MRGPVISRAMRTAPVFLLLSIVLFGGIGVEAISNLHFGINVKWPGRTDKGPTPHMTIAHYARFPEAKAGLLPALGAICSAIRESTRGTLQASGRYKPEANPEGKSCIYTGPVGDTLNAARAALDKLTGKDDSYSKRMLVPHVHMGSKRGRRACPATYDFDFSRIYYNSVQTGSLVVSCTKRTAAGHTEPPATAVRRKPRSRHQATGSRRKASNGKPVRATGEGRVNRGSESAPRRAKTDTTKPRSRQRRTGLKGRRQTPEWALMEPNRPVDNGQGRSKSSQKTRKQKSSPSFSSLSFSSSSSSSSSSVPVSHSRPRRPILNLRRPSSLGGSRGS